MDKKVKKPKGENIREDVGSEETTPRHLHFYPFLPRYFSPGSSWKPDSNVGFAKSIEEEFHFGTVSGDTYIGYEPDELIGILRNYKDFFRTPQNKLHAIKKGLHSSSLLDLMLITGATRTDVAQLLDLTEPTLRKYIKAGKELNIVLSEHILQLFELFDKGMDTFGSLDEFKSWLPKHNIGINARPIDLLDTITGINIVINELLRIDHGVLA